jgi:hypothetical protein
MAHDDANAPHVRAGEFVVVDGADCEPFNGELYLFEFGRNTPAGPCRAIMETRLRHFECVGFGDGEMGPADLWMMYPLNRPRSGADLQVRFRTGVPVYTGDGPCKAEHLPILGRVVGVYQAPEVPALPAARRIGGRHA